MSHDLPHDDDDDDRRVINRNMRRKSNVIIMSYENDYVPFLSTVADTLTQFFTDYNYMKVGVRSYIIDEQRPLKLVERDNYMKEVCDIPTVAADIQQFKKNYGSAPVMFLFCHGSERTSKNPASLEFKEDIHVSKHHTRTVWARCPENYKSGKWKGAVFLSHLIDGSGVVFVMCCNGDQIIKEDYVCQMGESNKFDKIPDILFYDCGLVVVSSTVILTALVIKLMSFFDMSKNPLQHELYTCVKSSIVTIFKIVKCCNNDINKFWNFLLDMRCIEKFTGGNFYRLYGHVWHDHIPQYQKEQIFNDFKALTLMSRGTEQPKFENYKSVDPFPSDSLPRVWDVLLNYFTPSRELSKKVLGSVKQQQSIDIRVAQQCINKYLVNTSS